MSDDLERLQAALSNAREDDCGNDELCMEAAGRLAELRLNLRLTRKRLDAALSRATAAEEGRHEAMAALIEARDLILGASFASERYPKAYVLMTGEVDRTDD